VKGVKVKSVNVKVKTLPWPENAVHGRPYRIPRVHHQSEAAATATLVVHSANVQAPQRHNSESVLYYEREQSTKNPAVGGQPAPSPVCPSSSANTINRMGGWNQRVERKK
jgi:hypothetical protein